MKPVTSPQASREHHKREAGVGSPSRSVGTEVGAERDANARAGSDPGYVRRGGEGRAALAGSEKAAPVDTEEVTRTAGEPGGALAAEERMVVFLSASSGNVSACFGTNFPIPNC